MGEPRTIDVGLTTQGPSETAALPQGVTFDLEAVFVAIDTSGAGGPVTAELTIAEQSGDVIATKRQSATIPAGTTGTATWALRLADDGGSSVLPPSALREALAVDTVTLPPAGGGPGVTVPWTVVTDAGVWDYTNPLNPKCLHQGLLILTIMIECHSATPMTVGKTLFAQLEVPGPPPIFPDVIGFFGVEEATVAIPAPSIVGAAAGGINMNDGATLVIANNGLANIDVTYILRSDLILT